MDALVPILVVASGQIFLALVAARVAVWVLIGWRRTQRGEGPEGPGGPGGGLRVLAGGVSRSAQAGAGGLPLRKAA